jgi:hypothetical protein
MAAAKIITTYPSTLMTGRVDRAKAFIDRVGSGADYAPGSGAARLDEPTTRSGPAPGNYPEQSPTSLR